MNKLGSLLLIILTIFVLIYFYRYNPSSSDKFFLFCPTKLLFEFDCPGCGGQRYLHYILNLDFKNAFKANAFLFFTFPILFYLFISSILKPFHVSLPIITITNQALFIFLIITLIFTLIRNTSFYFHILSCL
ncbi:hypothetical protein UJ101_01270 [Flavobacteriaceae bacterium UJ101]|nr:hypothetical protein UJ101_01270 [Flavobacteriaceae bacterium UJ101]